MVWLSPYKQLTYDYDGLYKIVHQMKSGLAMVMQSKRISDGSDLGLFKKKQTKIIQFEYEKRDLSSALNYFLKTIP